MADHFRLKYDMHYSTGEFRTLLHERHDADEKLISGFAQFLSIIGEQVSEESLMESGLAFRPCSPAISDHESQSAGTDEFEDAVATLGFDENKSSAVPDKPW